MTSSCMATETSVTVVEKCTLHSWRNPYMQKLTQLQLLEPTNFIFQEVRTPTHTAVCDLVVGINHTRYIQCNKPLNNLDSK